MPSGVVLLGHQFLHLISLFALLFNFGLGESVLIDDFVDTDRLGFVGGSCHNSSMLEEMRDGHTINEVTRGAMLVSMFIK